MFTDTLPQAVGWAPSGHQGRCRPQQFLPIPLGLSGLCVHTGPLEPPPSIRTLGRTASALLVLPRECPQTLRLRSSCSHQ